ncbi:MAG: rhodanese-like domain-containing protein [Gallionellaceae bacterium]|nr:rhodanese-like domain-containing protein [Gallionellaceae bacterium]
MQFIRDNIGLVSVACLSGAMLLWSLFGNRMRGLKEAGIAEALQLINHKNALVLDVREAKEFDAGHILNSKLIPLGNLRQRANELEHQREQPIVVVCRSGQRSSAACTLLGKQGFSQVYNLSGGILAWEKANMPLEK